MTAYFKIACRPRFNFSANIPRLLDEITKSEVNTPKFNLTKNPIVESVDTLHKNRLAFYFTFMALICEK